MYIFDKAEQEKLFDVSRTSQRLRMNYNIHPQLSDPVQRLFNAMQPLSYVQPVSEDGDWVSTRNLDTHRVSVVVWLIVL